jgi:hypothetical protein
MATVAAMATMTLDDHAYLSMHRALGASGSRGGSSF